MIHHTIKALTVCMSHCYHLLYSMQYHIEGLCDAADYGQLEDVKEYVQNGVDVNEINWVSNYIYDYFTLL